MSKLNNIPSGWTVKKIPEILFFQEGPGVRNWQFAESGVKLLNVGNINNQEIDLSTTKIHLTHEEAFGKYKHFLVDEGDLLIACSGIVVNNFHNKIAFAKREHLPLSLNTSTMRFKVLQKDEISLNFFRYFLQTVHFTNQLQKLITGSAQLNFGPSHIKKINVLLPPLDQQKKIAAILDAADAYRQKTKALIAKYDELTQSLFLDMFGDPVKNEKGWEIKPIKEFGIIITGNTPPRNNEENYNSEFIEWIKTDNIDSNFLYLTKSKEYLSESGLKKGRLAKSGSLLVACIAGSINSIGRSAIADRDVAFNQQINAIEPYEFVNTMFLYHLFRSSTNYIQSHASLGMKRMLSKGDFQKIKMIIPPSNIQNQFAERVQAIEVQKSQAQASLEKAEDLFNSLLQQAFKGELN